MNPTFRKCTRARSRICRIKHEQVLATIQRNHSNYVEISHFIWILKQFMRKRFTAFIFASVLYIDHYFIRLRVQLRTCVLVKPPKIVTFLHFCIQKIFFSSQSSQSISLTQRAVNVATLDFLSSVLNVKTKRKVCIMMFKRKGEQRK